MEKARSKGSYTFIWMFSVRFVVLKKGEKKTEREQGRVEKARKSSPQRLAFISRAGHTVHIARRGRAFAGKIAFGTKSASSTKSVSFVEGVKRKAWRTPVHGDSWCPLVRNACCCTPCQDAHLAEMQHAWI